VRGCEQAGDEAGVGIGCRVVQEGLHFRGCWGQAGEVERQPANLGHPRGGRGGLEPFLTQARGDQRIDRVLSRRRRRAHRFLQRPVPAPGGALGDPAAQQFGLPGLQARLVRLRRRHHFVLVGRNDPPDELAGLGAAGNHGLDGVGGRPFPRIQPEVGLAVAFVGTMAAEAVVRQNRQHVAAEADRFRRRSLGSGEQDEDRDEWVGPLHSPPSYRKRRG
jgi:hypothetical protein